MIRHNLSVWRAKRNSNKGITKAHLARKIHVDRSYMTRLEQGKIQPSAEVMFKLADYFECKIEDIFKYTQE